MRSRVAVSVNTSGVSLGQNVVRFGSRPFSDAQCETRRCCFDVESVRDDDCRGLSTLVVGYVAVFPSSSFNWYHVSYRGVAWVRPVDLTIALAGVWVQDIPHRSGFRAGR